MNAANRNKLASKLNQLQSLTAIIGGSRWNNKMRLWEGGDPCAAADL